MDARRSPGRTGGARHSVRHPRPGADLLILDDVTKNMQEADSPTYRRRVIDEFRSTLLTRLHPGGSVIIIGSRWHPEDLTGVLLAEEPERWRQINIPAVAEAGIPDALSRAPGVAMISAVGRTPEHFADLRRSVGERTWYAEFQGVPASPEGNVIRRAWLDAWRLSAMPANQMRTVVAVDPSDSGQGDAAGIVAASLTPEGVVAIHRDVSERMTPEAWARAAAELAIDTGASEIAVETFSAREGYLSVLNTTLRRYRLAHPIRVTSWPPKNNRSGRGGATRWRARPSSSKGWKPARCGWSGTSTASRARRPGGRTGSISPTASRRRSSPMMCSPTAVRCTSSIRSTSPAGLGRGVSHRPRRGCDAGLEADRDRRWRPRGPTAVQLSPQRRGCASTPVVPTGMRQATPAA